MYTKAMKECVQAFEHAQILKNHFRRKSKKQNISWTQPRISQLVCLNELYKKWRITLTREGKNLFTRYSGTLAP